MADISTPANVGGAEFTTRIIATHLVLATKLRHKSYRTDEEHCEAVNRVDVGIVAVVVAATVPCWLASVGHDADALRDGSYRDGFQWSQQLRPDATSCSDEAMRRTGPQVSASAWLEGCVEALDAHR